MRRGEDVDTKEERGIGLLEVVIAFVAYLVVLVIGAVILVAVYGQDFLVQGPNPQLALVGIAAASAFIGAMVALVPRVRSLAAVGLRRTSGRWLLIGAGVGLLGYAINRLVVLLYVWISGDYSNPQQGMANIVMDGSILQFALLIALGGLLTPLGEELLFRGTLFTWLRRWGFVLAAIISAVVFGIFHGFNVVLPVAIVLGLLNAYVYEKSGSIWPAVIAHAVNNTFLLALTRILAEAGVLG